MLRKEGAKKHSSTPANQAKTPKNQIEPSHNDEDVSHPDVSHETDSDMQDLSETI